MAQDRLNHVVRAAVGLSQMELQTSQEVLNHLNGSAWSEEFHVALIRLMGERGWTSLVHPPAPEGFRLHLSPRQYSTGGTSGSDIREYLRKQKLWDQRLSLEDPQIKEWLSNPHQYPESLKDKRIILWGSCRSFATECVAALSFSTLPYTQVYIEWVGVERKFSNHFYTLLKAEVR